MLSFEKIRKNSTWLYLCSVMVVLGFVLNRLNISITGIQMKSDTFYFPSWQEVSITLAIVAFGFGMFSLAVQYLPIFVKVNPIKTGEDEKDYEEFWAKRILQ